MEYNSSRCSTVMMGIYRTGCLVITAGTGDMEGRQGGWLKGGEIQVKLNVTKLIGTSQQLNLRGLGLESL